MLDEFLLPEPRDATERAISFGFKGYSRMKFAEFLTDKVLGENLPSLDRQNKELDVRLKRRQLGMLDDDDYEKATNSRIPGMIAAGTGQAITKHALPAIGRRTNPMNRFGQDPHQEGPRMRANFMADQGTELQGADLERRAHEAWVKNLERNEGIKADPRWFRKPPKFGFGEDDSLYGRTIGQILGKTKKDFGNVTKHSSGPGGTSTTILGRIGRRRGPK